MQNMKLIDGKLDDVIAAGQAHEQRLNKNEADVKALGDGMGTMGRHVQAMDDRLKAHIGGTVADLNQALLAIDVALRKTVSALEDRLGEFQGNAQELMDRTHQGLTQLQERLAEAEKAIHLEKQKAPPENRPSPGTTYFDVSSPARPRQSDPTAGGSAGGWQQGGAPGYQGWQQGGAPGYQGWQTGGVGDVRGGIGLHADEVHTETSAGVQ